MTNNNNSNNNNKYTTSSAYSRAKQRRAEKRRRRKMIRRVINVIIAIVIFIGFFTLVNDMVTDFETYSSTAKSHLRIELNEGKQEAIDRYWYYINKDEYLFNGSVTIHMMAEKYGLDGKELYKIYEASDCETAQEFFEEYVQYRAICEEFENNTNNANS